MRKLNTRGALALMAALAMVLAACTSSDDDDGGGDTTTTAAGGEAPTGEPGTGVTEDSIKVAYTFVDTDALQEIGVEVFHGPYADIMTALVDDLNANGGINGRTVEVINIPYNPAGGNVEALAACTTATEDEQVFAVLGGVLGDANLCIVEQHETALVAGGQTPEFLERAQAPWASWTSVSTTAIQALVVALESEDKFEGRTVAVYGLAANQAEVDLATEALEEAGIEVAFEAVNDGNPDDRTSIDAQDATLAQRMSDEGVDAVFIAGQNVPGPVWGQNDFFPAMWVTDNAILSVFAGEGLAGFDEVLAVGGPPAQTAWESDVLQACLAIYEEASGETPPSPDDGTDDNQSPVTALNDACSALTVFREAALAAGDTLNNDTFLEGIESLTEIDLPGSVGSFGPDQYSALREFYLFEPNPDYEGLGTGEATIPVSDESFRVDE